MKKLVVGAACIAAVLTSCNKSYETTESGIKYRVLSHEDDSRQVTAGEMILVNLKMTTEGKDSLLMETFSSNNPRYIPADEPTLKEALVMLSKGDSVEMLVNADTLFQKSFGVPRPEGMKDGENVKFVIKIVDIFNQQEIEKKGNEQAEKLRQKDSTEMNEFLKTMTEVKTTATGLHYSVVKEGKGKQPKNGDKVSVKYKGTFFNGEMFDGNMDGGEPFTFTLGLGQVIPGWEEAVSLMKEGSSYKFVVPWQLAYGQRGSGPIPPCTSLVFDIELVKIN